MSCSGNHLSIEAEVELRAMHLFAMVRAICCDRNVRATKKLGCASAVVWVDCDTAPASSVAGAPHRTRCNQNGDCRSITSNTSYDEYDDSGDTYDTVATGIDDTCSDEVDGGTPIELALRPILSIVDVRLDVSQHRLITCLHMNVLASTRRRGAW